MGVVVVFVILSISILLNTSPKEVDTGLGSDPGNILSGGEVAEDEDFIYYVAGKGFFRFDIFEKELTKLSD